MERGVGWRSAHGGCRWEWGRMERGRRGAEDGEEAGGGVLGRGDVRCRRWRATRAGDGKRD